MSIKKDKKPNILFLMTDQQQAQTVFSSACKTPNLKKFSEQGITFTRAYTPNAICSPTRASILTGVLPHTHGMYDCTHTVDKHRAEYDDSLPTWPQRLCETGYQTAYFGKWHVERSGELHRFGFQWYDKEDEINTLEKSYRDYRTEIGLSLNCRIIHGKTLGGNGYKNQLLYGITDEPADTSRPYFIYSKAIEFIEEKIDFSKPWCIFISTPEPHDPYIAYQEFYEKYNLQEISQPGNFSDDLSGKPNVLKRMQKVWQDLQWRDFAEAITCYYASCSLIDAQIGRILDLLKKKGELENTIIIYTSDHGDMMGGHRLFTKGITPYEEVYKVPLIIRTPNLPKLGNSCNHIVNIGGIGATILELTGCSPLPDRHFPSFAPLLDDVTYKDWQDITFAEFHGQRYFFTQRILWEGQYKFIFNGFDFDELYDLERDPGEMHNLSEDPDYRNIKERMLRRMWELIWKTGDKTLINAHYWTLRFLDLGPDCNKL